MTEDRIVRISEYRGQMRLAREGGTPMLVFPAWEGFRFLRHGMSTRDGGVSSGIYASMNFKEDGEDSQENVRENYRRIAARLGCEAEKMVRPSLAHGNRVHVVTEQDYGNGTVRPSGLPDTDALVTDRPGVMLCATFADCVPLLFVDPKRRVIGLAHSGWRGTVKRIGAETVRVMEELGSHPEDILAAIGPCICGGCYEVGPDTAGEFQRELPGTEGILEPGREGHYQLNLRRANERIFLEAGILPEHILVSDICTCCNPGLLFSHRATGGRRGALGAFLGLA